MSADVDICEHYDNADHCPECKRIGAAYTNLNRWRKKIIDYAVKLSMGYPEEFPPLVRYVMELEKAEQRIKGMGRKP